MKKIGIIILILSAFLFSCENPWMKDLVDKLDKDGKIADGYGGGGYAEGYDFWFTNYWKNFDYSGGYYDTGEFVDFFPGSMKVTNSSIYYNVRIVDGGKYFNTKESKDAIWVYLFDIFNDEKIGIAYIIPGIKYKAILIGKTDTLYGDSLLEWLIPGLDASDMQDFVNGFSFTYYY
ncbi:MAG: hypothetical protein FWE72_07185 [Spirochaetaceae bacterium]|nr:hypothetical protein [Spirochaetaceae bacterium]